MMHSNIMLYPGVMKLIPHFFDIGYGDFLERKTNI